MTEFVNYFVKYGYDKPISKELYEYLLRDGKPNAVDMPIMTEPQENPHLVKLFRETFGTEIYEFVSFNDTDNADFILSDLSDVENFKKILNTRKRGDNVNVISFIISSEKFPFTKENCQLIKDAPHVWNSTCLTMLEPLKKIVNKVLISPEKQTLIDQIAALDKTISELKTLRDNLEKTEL